jgi:ATP-dependent helicase/nuclease subunit B
MPIDPVRRALDAAGILVVATPQRATALRLAHAREQLAAGRRSWRTPPVMSLGGLLQHAAARLRLQGVPLPRLLSAYEESLLWGEAARELAEGLDLLMPESLARGLQRAARSAADHGIDPARIGADPAPESGWLFRAMTQVERRAAMLGALPRHALVPALAALPAPEIAGPLWRAGLDPLPAALARLLSAWGAGVQAMDGLPEGADPVQPTVVCAEDPGAEIERAAAWCRDRLGRDPGARLLLVIPDLRQRRALLQRTLCAMLEPGTTLEPGSTPRSFAIEGGQPLADYPEPAAALEILALLTRPLELQRAVAIVQSAAWGPARASARALLAARIRATRSGSLGWRDVAAGARSTGEGDGTGELAAFAAAIEAAAATFAAERAPATVWAERCSRALGLAGWPALGAVSSATQQVRAAWASLLGEMAGLSRALGAVTAQRAVDVLGAMARQQSYAPASGDVPVLVTDSLDDPVLRYDGIWVSSLQAERWPAPARVDPFIPWYLQREAGVEVATAAGCLGQARRQLDALRRACGELVLSHARLDGDAELEPSPLLLAWPTALATVRPTSLAGQMRSAGSVELESRADRVGLGWDARQPLPRGTRSLELQNTCGFRAYAELRLHAAEAETREPGIDARERGILLHEVLQRVWIELRSQQRLRASSPEQLDALVGAAVAEAARQRSSAQPEPELARANAREFERAQAVARALLERELARAPFEIVELETQREAAIGGARLRLRTDRVDRLDDGRLVLIDYKTGAAVQRDWLGARADPVQLFVYLAALRGAAQQPAPVAALGMIHLVRRGKVFAMVAEQADLLPDAKRVPDWSAQLQRWNGQVERLAAQFLAGAAALDPLAGACRTCHLASLCRRTELLQQVVLQDASGGDDSLPEEATP